MIKWKTIHTTMIFIIESMGEVIIAIIFFFLIAIKTKMSRRVHVDEIAHAMFSIGGAIIG